LTGLCFFSAYDDGRGNPIVFEADPQKVSGFPGVATYTVEKSFHVPDKIITFSSGKTYWMETESVSADGAPRLRLESAKLIEEEYWDTTGEEILTLTKTGWGAKEGKSGRYPFTENVALPGWLMLYTPEELGFTRAEIYARHGHIFEDPAYKAHFEAQHWYNAVSGNAEEKFTPEERLNVEMIGVIEKQMKEES